MESWKLPTSWSSELERSWMAGIMDFVNATLAWIPLYKGLSAGVLFTIVALVIGICYLIWSLFPSAPVKPEVPEQLDGHPGLLDQEEPMSGDIESSHPMDLSRPREAFSNVWKTTESGFLSGATLQYSPGGHGLAFPTWITPPLSFVVPVGSPDYDIEYVEVIDYFADDGASSSAVVEDANGIRWLLLKADFPNLRAFLEDMHKDAKSVIYVIDCLRYDYAKELLLSMKAKLWASFQGSTLALWIEVHLAHVLLRVALLDLAQANTVLEQALTTFSQCLDDMTYKDEGHYLKRLFCSAYLGRAWYFLIKGQLEEATQDIHRVEEYEWEEDQNKLSATININWAKTAIYLSAGDLNNAKESFHRVGFRVEARRGAVNESQRFPLDIHMERNKGNLYIALHVCARCLLSVEEPVQFDPITDQASKRIQQICMGVIGDLWFALGACHEAHKYYTMAAGALEIKGKSGDLILRAAGLVGRANVHMRLRKDKEVQHLEHAEEDYKESLSIYEGLGHAEGQVIVKCNLGTLCMAQGTQADQVKAQGLFDQALDHYRQAKELASRVKVRPTILAELDCKMGQIHLEKGDLTEAINLLEKGRKLRQTNQEIEPLVQAWIEHQLGHCYLKRWEKEKTSVTLRTAKTHLINAIKHFASVQLETRGTEAHYERLWFTMFEEQKETYALLQWCLACQNRPIDAVVWGERSRSRALMQDKWEGVMQVSGDHGIWMQNLHPKKFDEVSCETAWESLQGWSSLYELNVNIAIVQYTICRGFGLLIYVLDGSSKPSIYHKSFTELGDKLGIRNVEHIEHLVAKTVGVLSLGGSRKTKRDGEEDEQILFIKLSELLLLPIEEELNKKRGLENLIIIPHEHLHRVPFPALYCGEQTTMLGFKKKPRQHLIEKYALSCVDSIRSLIRCSVLYKSLCQKELHSDWQVSKSAALIVGIENLHLDLGLSILDNAEVEAEGIAQILQSRLTGDVIQPVLGPEATKGLVMKRLPKAQLVHFATHALITPRYEEGGIFFSKPLERSGEFIGESIQASLNDTRLEEPVRSSTSSDKWRGREVHERTILQKELAEAVFLNADEISALKLLARLVVLSACQTGRGVIGGEGVAGLGRALTRAGVPCTVLALWDVHDGAAKALMITFYTNLICEGMSVATALQKAMVQMMHTKSSANEDANLWSVKHWAAFQTFGLQSVCLQARSSQGLSYSKFPREASSMYC